MSLKLLYLRDHIIAPTLYALRMHSEEAVSLMLGTCAVESDFGAFRKQLGDGPALGIYQMEEVTYRDCWRYIGLHEELLKKVRALCPGAFNQTFSLIEKDDVLATVMARIKYWMVPEAIPSGDVFFLAAYWKVNYNSMLGGGTVKDFMAKYKEYVEC